MTEPTPPPPPEWQPPPPPPGQPAYDPQTGQPVYQQPAYDPAAPPAYQPGGYQPGYPEMTPPIGYPAAPPRGRRTLPIVLVVVVVLALIAAGVVFLPKILKTKKTSAAAKIGSGPEQLVPASSVAFSRINLALSSDQKQHLTSLLTTVGVPNVDAKDPIGSLASRGTNKGDFTWAGDVAPWLGDSAGVAAVDTPDGVVPVAFIATKDDTKAQAFILKANAQRSTDTDPKSAIKDHFLVLSTTQAGLDALNSAPARLANDANYRAALSHVDGDDLIIGYADLGGAYAKALERVRKNGQDTTQLSSAAGLAKGQAVFGLKADADMVQLEASVLNGTDLLGGADLDAAMLTGLPDSTLAAVAVGGLGETLRKLQQSLTTSGNITDAQLREFEQSTGLSIATDLFPLLAKTSVLAVTSLPTSAAGIAQAVGLKIQVGDPGAAERVVTKLRALAGGRATLELSNGVLYAATTSDAIGALKSGGHLGDQPNFKRAVGDLTGARSVLYVNAGPLTGLLGAFALGGGAEGAALGHLSAVGFVTTSSGGVSSARLRFVIH